MSTNESENKVDATKLIKVHVPKAASNWEYYYCTGNDNELPYFKVIYNVS